MQLGDCHWYRYKSSLQLHRGNCEDCMHARTCCCIHYKSTTSESSQITQHTPTCRGHRQNIWKAATVEGTCGAGRETWREGGRVKKKKKQDGAPSTPSVYECRISPYLTSNYHTIPQSILHTTTPYVLVMVDWWDGCDLCSYVTKIFAVVVI